MAPGAEDNAPRQDEVLVEGEPVEATPADAELAAGRTIGTPKTFEQ